MSPSSDEEEDDDDDEEEDEEQDRQCLGDLKMFTPLRGILAAAVALAKMSKSADGGGCGKEAGNATLGGIMALGGGGSTGNEGDIGVTGEAVV